MVRPSLTAVPILALMVAIGACSTDAGDLQTSTTAVPTSASPTTTTTTPAETELPGSGFRNLEPGITYTASGFWAPVALTVEEEGWRSAGTKDTWLHFQYLAATTGGWDLDISVLAFEPSEPPERVIDDLVSFAARDRAEILQGPSSATFAGFDATFLDLEAPAETQADDPCASGTPGHTRFARSMHGVVSIMYEPDPAGGTFGFGVSRCRMARIWVVDVDGSTITVIAAATNRDLFADLIPVAEKLLSGIRFDL